MRLTTVATRIVHPHLTATNLVWKSSSLYRPFSVNYPKKVVSTRSISFSTSCDKVMAASKIQLYSLATPNGMKVGIALEEMGLEYEAHTIDIRNGEQFEPSFVAINPNSKIPAIVDPDGPDGKPITVFESGAILLYLAKKSNKFLPEEPRLKWETIEWLFFQMAGVGPMFGQFGHFFLFAKEKCKDPYPLERYANEAKRLLGVLEKRLEGREYIIDAGYTIVDMATFPWVHSLEEKASDFLEYSKYPNVIAWKSRCLQRPATIRGLKVCSIS
ncbi:hypothetical protein O6H91_13G012000 [Diphasiastrum complanatum]|uniref:Uncharacterized protein n=1 Tax=Diphasiastrum complanatum TaxID=34168 RepID=A0ACC2BS71_DIPCM|nr:hypothetical protein O6H91_13G012000 [Diphasiastrum complanatum]